MIEPSHVTCLPSTPVGWKRHKSKRRKRRFYYHHKTKTSLWHRPSSEKAALAEEEAALAENLRMKRDLRKKRKVAPASEEDLPKRRKVSSAVVSPAISAVVSEASDVKTATEPVVSEASNVETATEPASALLAERSVRPVSRKTLVNFYQKLGRPGPKYYCPRDAYTELVNLVKSLMGDQGSLSQAGAIALDIVKHCAISEISTPRRKDNAPTALDLGEDEAKLKNKRELIKETIRGNECYLDHPRYFELICNIIDVSLPGDSLFICQLLCPTQHERGHHDLSCGGSSRSGFPLGECTTVKNMKELNNWFGLYSNIELGEEVKSLMQFNTRPICDVPMDKKEFQRCGAPTASEIVIQAAVINCLCKSARALNVEPVLFSLGGKKAVKVLKEVTECNFIVKDLTIHAQFFSAFCPGKTIAGQTEMGTNVLQAICHEVLACLRKQAYLHPKQGIDLTKYESLVEYATGREHLLYIDTIENILERLKVLSREGLIKWQANATDDEIREASQRGGYIGGNIMGGRFTTAARKLLANEPLSDEEAVAHQINVDGGNARGNLFTTAAKKQLANEDLSNEEAVAHQQCVDGGTIMGGRFTTAKQKIANNEDLSNEEDAARQAQVDGGTIMGGRFTTAKQKIDNNEPLSNEEDVARQAQVDGGTTTGGTKREAKFANGAVEVRLKCCKCWRWNKCGIYPEGHKNRMKADGGCYKPRSHWCPHCKTQRAFYTKKELKDKRKHNLKHKKEGGRNKQITFDYSKFDGLTGACLCVDCTQS